MFFPQLFVVFNYFVIINLMISNQKLKKIFPFLFLLFLGLATPLYFVQAIPIVTPLINGLILAIFEIPVLISFLALKLSGATLGWVLGDFITLPYTSGGIVEIGWSITKDLTNMLFVIGLAVIGLSTALGIENNQAKRTLPKLIGIILLINFTPVICGSIIDACNILMNFFLENLSGPSHLINKVNAPYTTVEGFLKQVSVSRPSSLLLMQSLFMIAFNWITALIFFIWTFLFLARYIAIWILVILSPIAFFSYIFPSTQGFWRGWWKQFINWCTIGITGAFFLYLGLQSVLVLESGVVAPITDDVGLVDATFLAWTNTLVPYIMSVAIIILGFIAAISTSAMGASQIIKTAQSGGEKAGIWAAKHSFRAPGKIKDATKKGVKGAAGRWEDSKHVPGKPKTFIKNRKRDWATRSPEIRAKMTEKQQQLESNRFIGKGAFIGKATMRAGGMIRKIGEETVSSIPPKEDWTSIHPMAKEIFPTKMEEEMKIEKMEKQYIKEAEKTAAKDIEEVIRITRKKAHTDKQKARKSAFTKILLKARPDRAKEFGKTVTKVLDETTPRNFVKNTLSEALKNEDTFWAASISQIKALGKEGSKEQKEAILTVLPEIKKQIAELVRIGNKDKAAELSDKVLRIEQEF